MWMLRVGGWEDSLKNVVFEDFSIVLYTFSIKTCLIIIKPLVIYKGWYAGNLWTHLVCAIRNIRIRKSQCISSVWTCMAHSDWEIFVHGSYTLSFTEISIVRFIPEISLFMQCQDLILSPVTGRTRTNIISHPQMTSEFHACRLQHLDLIWGVTGSTRRGWAAWGRGKAINHFCHLTRDINYYPHMR